MKKNILRTTILLLFLYLVAVPAYSLGKPNDVGQNSNNRGLTQNEQTTTSGRLESCQAKEAGIKNRSASLVRLVTTMEEKFDAIAQKVETYYTSKVVPSGKSVSNYNDLVNAIQTEKTAVQIALTKAQTDANNFFCSNTDPKQELTQFRIDMQSVKAALKDYRTAIKNLIVAVHSVGGK